MKNDHSEILKKKKSSKFMKEIELVPSKKNSNNNSRDKIKKNKEINLKQMINKNNNPEIFNNKNEYQKPHKTKKLNTPKTPLLTSKQSIHSTIKNPQSTIQYNDNAVKNYLNRNAFKLSMYTKENKNKKFIKTYISPLFDYNIKNSYKNNNIRLNIKNNNSKPIKIINDDDGYKTLYTNKNKNKKYHISNSSVDYKSSSVYDNNSNRDNLSKRNSVNSKNGKNNNNKNNTNRKVNTKYISYTPDCTRKVPFIKKKLSNNELNDENKRKEEEINIKLEKEIKNKINSGIKTNKNKNNYINNINGTTTSGSRNRVDDIKSTNYSNSQSQKNIFRYDNYSNDLYNNNNNNKNTNTTDKPEYNTINTEKKYSHSKSKNNYKKYYSLLEKKIKTLNEEIESIKEEEKSLILQLINYKEKEKECNYIRQLREEIKKYKNVIEKSNKACEEYSLEILKIKNIIGNSGD